MPTPHYMIPIDNQDVLLISYKTIYNHEPADRYHIHEVVNSHPWVSPWTQEFRSADATRTPEGGELPS